MTTTDERAPIRPHHPMQPRVVEAPSGPPSGRDAALVRTLHIHLDKQVDPLRLGGVVRGLYASLRPFLAPPRPDTGTEEVRLSERELAVLRLMADGLTNARIGVRLHITEDTVKTYNRHLFRKLGARDRAHAVHLGHQHGLLGGAA